MPRARVSHLDDVDVDRSYDDPSRRGRPAPWLMLNMISTIDGAISHEGTSGPLGLSGDRRVFRAVRDHADVVLVGSGTVHAETYSPPAWNDEVAARRRLAGASGPLRYAVVTNSAELDLTKPLFRDPVPPEARPIVVTRRLEPDRRSEIEAHADVLETGEDEVDLSVALAELHRLGFEVVLAEGGPVLNGALHELDLIDELFVTLSPHLSGGSGPSILGAGDDEHLRRFDLVHALASEDGELLTRFRRRR